MPACADITDSQIESGGDFQATLAEFTTTSGNACADTFFVTAGARRKLRFRIPHAAQVGYRGRAITLSGTVVLDSGGYGDGFGSGCIGMAVPVPGC